MALTASVISSAIQTAALADLTGPNAAKLFSAIGKAVHAWIILPVNVYMTGVTTGQAGAGSISLGKLFMLPAIPVVMAGLSGASQNGPTAPLLAKAVSIGLATAISGSGTYSGLSVGVAIGADVSKVVFANPATLVPLLTANMVGDLGGFGANAASVAAGLAVGIANQVLTITGVGVVAGTPVPLPIPSVGISPFSTVG